MKQEIVSSEVFEGSVEGRMTKCIRIFFYDPEKDEVIVKEYPVKA